MLLLLFSILQVLFLWFVQKCPGHGFVEKPANCPLFKWTISNRYQGNDDRQQNREYGKYQTQNKPPGIFQQSMNIAPQCITGDNTTHHNQQFSPCATKNHRRLLIKESWKFLFIHALSAFLNVWKHMRFCIQSV